MGAAALVTATYSIKTGFGISEGTYHAKAANKHRLYASSSAAFFSYLCWNTATMPHFAFQKILSFTVKRAMVS
jgi:hypothetical protein